ncbi:hypothetical protein TURU_053671 [Turdus rufiventris]|nr:hypothetical protein TURU_053671 [Turdus rufiventris]
MCMRCSMAMDTQELLHEEDMARWQDRWSEGPVEDHFLPTRSVYRMVLSPVTEAVKRTEFLGIRSSYNELSSFCFIYALCIFTSATGELSDNTKLRYERKSELADPGIKGAGEIRAGNMNEELLSSCENSDMANS